MTTMIVEVYDALKEAGASEEKAIAAAIADYEKHFVSLETDIKDIKADLKILKAEVGILKWMIGFVIAGTISMIIKSFL
jgi:hypothetical protein